MYVVVYIVMMIVATRYLTFEDVEVLFAALKL